jgi:hypothetical protein
MTVTEDKLVVIYLQIFAHALLLALKDFNILISQ